MPRFSGKKADTGVPVTIDKDRYVEGDVIPSMEGGVVLGEKPGNVAFPIQIDALGYLKVNLVAGGYAQHEYQDGDVNTGAYGHLCLGDDGANLQTLKVGANGRLQVEVVVGNYDAVQYQDGAAVASPFGYVAMGHDGSNVFPVIVDGNGYLQIDIRTLPIDTFAAEGQALGKGVLMQGDDGVDRHNIAVDVGGRLQVDIIDEPKASVFNSVADVSLPATTKTQIISGNTSRLCILISSKKNNTATIRIGDSNTSASRGIELAPGQSISIETTEAVYGYNPAAGAVSVAVIYTEN